MNLLTHWDNSILKAVFRAQNRILQLFFWVSSKSFLIVVQRVWSDPGGFPDFRELFSSYIEAPNIFFLKNNFLTSKLMWQAVFHYRTCESVENELLWCSLQNRNVNTRSSGESVSFGGWRTWRYATFYLSLLWKNNFSSKFWKKVFGMAHP